MVSLLVQFLVSNSFPLDDQCRLSPLGCFSASACLCLLRFDQTNQPWYVGNLPDRRDVCGCILGSSGGVRPTGQSGHMRLRSQIQVDRK